MLANDLQRGKVAENLVRSGVRSYPVLILHHLPTIQETPINDTTFDTLGTALIYPNTNHIPIKDPAIFQPYEVKYPKESQDSEERVRE